MRQLPGGGGAIRRRILLTRQRQHFEPPVCSQPVRTQTLIALNGPNASFTLEAKSGSLLT